MRELAVQSSTATNTSADRNALNNEFAQLKQEITRIADQTEFNTKVLLNGSFSTAGTALSFQVGANAGQKINLQIKDMRATTATGLNLSNTLTVSTIAKASLAITTVNKAIATVSTERSTLGSVQNRLEHTIANLNTAAENLQASESRIRDVDMAKEMMNYSKNNILSQAAQAMLAQANQQPQGVLQLLR